MVERPVVTLKQYRRVATCYANLAPHCLAFVQLASIVFWLRILPNGLAPPRGPTRARALQASLGYDAAGRLENDPVKGAKRMGKSGVGGKDEGIGYELGHSDRELERLRRQARLFEPITRGFLRDAGIGPGMRVLDVGSGAGDVAFLAADLVGGTGEVVGVDRAAAAVAAARARAGAHPLRNVTFLEGDPAGMAFERPFDAVVGRYVLMFHPDPAAALRALAGHLRPGGVVVFHEPDWGGARSFPPSPSYDRCCRWIVEVFRRLGTETRMGVKLYAAFVAAGLPAPSMRLEAIIAGAADDPDRLTWVPELVGTLVPAMERLGVATAAEIDLETLAARVRDEVAAGGGVVVGRSEIGAWSRV